jgi:hypothetical protein
MSDFERLVEAVLGNILIDDQVSARSLVRLHCDAREGKNSGATPPSHLSSSAGVYARPQRKHAQSDDLAAGGAARGGSPR